jgi:adenosylcobinamide-phosphate synthase
MTTVLRGHERRLRRSRARQRALASAGGLALGYLADQWWGDPRRYHPVAGFGQVASRLEQRLYANARPAGVTYGAVLVGGTVGLGLALDRLTARNVPLHLLVTAAATWAVLGGRSLQREADTIAGQLEEHDLAAARQQIRNLVGRDPSQLDETELARACVESVAENTSDAVIAPLFWGAVAGVPGLLGYRAVNTLDAMVGHRSPRYVSFGWASARLDDVANWLPARLSGALTVAVAPLVGGSTQEAWRAVRRDAAQHPSPNAGVVEAAFAGALGIRLGGRNVYEGQAEDRGTLGEGRAVEVGDIRRAARVSVLISGLACGLVVVFRARGLVRS